jgi:translation initiation factor 1 (eIF-1/SUI1)
MDFLQETNNTNIIEVWVEERGRKSDTYVSGWDINDIELKENLKLIKKTKGCNGSVKEITKEVGKVKVLQLQGNHRDYVIEFIKNTGIDESLIKIKL